MQVLQRNCFPGISYWFGSGIFAGARVGVAVFLLPLGAGCGLLQSASSHNGALSLPPDGQVRLVTRQIDEGAKNTIHYKWSVIGERNWTDARIEGDKSVTMALGKTYPLNSATRRGGCNIWEADITVASAGDKASWEVRLHGSDGATAETHGSEDLKGRTPGDILEVRQSRDLVTGLPADVSLARVGQRDIRFKIEK